MLETYTVHKGFRAEHGIPTRYTVGVWGPALPRKAMQAMVDGIQVIRFHTGRTKVVYHALHDGKRTWLEAQVAWGRNLGVEEHLLVVRPLTNAPERFYDPSQEELGRLLPLLENSLLIHF